MPYVVCPKCGLAYLTWICRSVSKGLVYRFAMHSASSCSLVTIHCTMACTTQHQHKKNICSGVLSIVYQIFGSAILQLQSRCIHVCADVIDGHGLIAIQLQELKEHAFKFKFHQNYNSAHTAYREHMQKSASLFSRSYSTSILLLAKQK